RWISDKPFSHPSMGRSSECCKQEERYQELRNQRVRRHGWRCQLCGSMTNLEVHHQQFRSHSGEDTEQNLIYTLQDMRFGGAFFILAPSVSRGMVSATVVNQGYVAINSPHQNSVMYPSIGVNASGKAVIAFSVVGQDFFPSAGFASLDAV